MKRNFLPLLVVLIAAFSINASAQEEKQMKYLFQGKSLKISGFLGPMMGFSGLNNNFDFAFFMGGGGAILLNQTFYIGGYGMGLASKNYMTITQNTGGNIHLGKAEYEGVLEFGHGGLWVGYIHQSYKPVHFGASSKFGWGSINLYDGYFKNYVTDGNYYDNVFVITPQIEVEFNMASWLKFNVAAGYRFVTGINEKYQLSDGTTRYIFQKGNFSRPELSLNIYFGYFK